LQMAVFANANIHLSINSGLARNFHFEMDAVTTADADAC
jgi:hypothetical protein